MDTLTLSKHMTSPALHQNVLGNFNGPYSLGIGKDPVSALAILVLMVPDGVTQAFPDDVIVDAERVKVVVRGGFVLPRH